ncbi:MAG: hypothetical protein NC344_05545 [Bacteroidales bacterium]|nr:hypothetical protein [Bacteroidales bacterium]MCM1147283.1 hypothetical protein [Bacteroidales bacterium]MCM1206283.1 hypothetical protein [Bacillota bacterium]
MAKLGDYFGDGGAEPTDPPKGSMEWAEHNGGSNDTPQMKDPPPPKGAQERVEQDATQVDTTPPAKGTQEWAEQNSGENAPETHPAAQVETQPAEGNEAAPEAEGLSYLDMWKKLNPYEQPTPEQLEKERKKKKRDQIWAAIGDGVSALSNLFFTSQYAPNAYTGRNTMSEAVQNRWDKLEKDRKDNAINYFNGYLRAKAADDANDKDKRNWDYQLERDKLADARAAAAEARAAAKDKRDAAMHELNLMLAGHKINAAEAEAKRKGIEANYAEELEKAKVATEKARGTAQRASASASSARAGYYNRNGGKATYLWYDKDGREHYATSKEEAERRSRENGTWVENNETTTTTKEEPGKKNRKTGKQETNRTTTTVTKPNGGYSKKPAKKKSSPTAGNSSGGKKSPTA